MVFRKTLEIDELNYEKTKQVLINNGKSVSEQTHGSRKILFADNSICGFSEVDYYIPLSSGISSRQFNAFLGAFTKSLYNQIKKNSNLLNLKIDFDGVSRDKSYESWSLIKDKEIFYNVDLSSAYWQMAYRLNYISKKLYNNYIFKDDYKEAKRYCVSFLSRENEMQYFDNREISIVVCDTSILKQIYENIRHELYNTVEKIKQTTEHWLNYNIDGICIPFKDLKNVCDFLDENNLIYKINECIKIDSLEYYQKGKIRKF